MVMLVGLVVVLVLLATAVAVVVVVVVVEVLEKGLEPLGLRVERLAEQHAALGMVRAVLQQQRH
jgi:hypothetical protein